MVGELCNIKDFCLTINFLNNFYKGNKYNLAFQERFIKDYKKVVKQKKLPPSIPLTSQLYVEQSSV